MTLHHKPDWLKIKIPNNEINKSWYKKIKQKALCTVCVEAKCPNQLECFHNGIATFMLLGPSCTRSCSFCAINKTLPKPPDVEEPYNVADAIYQMGLKYCVLTMVTRDDLDDGGAQHLCKTIREIRNVVKNIKIEVLISDLNGNIKALNKILSEEPEVVNHNIETVPRLYNTVRPQANYDRSLYILYCSSIFNNSLITKSGIMLGLGETKSEVLQVMDDLRKNYCQILTIGQYLSPSNNHHPVSKYITPLEFEMYKLEAKKRGFAAVESAPLVRSSYRAEELYKKVSYKKDI